MKSLAPTLLILMLCASCSSRFAGANLDTAHPVAGTHSNGDKFEDLSFLKGLLNNKRIVVLGEDRHQNATGYIAHFRLIKFLTHQMGFTKVLFEYDMYSYWKGLDCYGKGMDATKVATELTRVQRYVFDDRIKLFRELLTDKNIGIGGFDIFYTDDTFGKIFVHELEQILNEMKVPLSDDDRQIFVRFSSDARAFKVKEIDAQYSLDRISNITESVTRDLQARTDKIWPDIYVQVIRSNVGLLKWAQSTTPLTVRDEKGKGKDLNLDNKYRDEQMARNILWWLKMYPTEKFVIVTHDYHGARQVKLDAGVRPMLDILTDSISSNEIYSLANITYGGYGGYTEGHPLKLKPRRRYFSIEWALHKKKSEFLIVDFNEARMKKDRRFKIRSLHFLLGDRRRWGRTYDGFFFIDTASPFKSRVMLFSDYLEMMGSFECDQTKKRLRMYE